MNTTTQIKIPSGYEATSPNYYLNALEDGEKIVSILCGGEQYPNGTKTIIYDRFDYQAIAEKTWKAGVIIKMVYKADKRRNATQNCTKHDVYQTLYQLRDKIEKKRFDIN